MMYAKHFECMYEGSMYGAGVTVFAVWGYVIAHTRKARVELNPKKIADTLGGEVKDIEAAITFLMSPDAGSRWKEADGRRLIKEGEYQYFLPSWEFYQNIRNQEERREYNRNKQAEHREKKKKRALGPGSREKMYEKAMAEGREELADQIVDGAMPNPAPTA